MMLMEHLLLLRIVIVDLIIDDVFLPWMISMSFHALTTTTSNNLLLYCLIMKGVVYRALILPRLSHHSRRLKVCLLMLMALL